MALITRRSLIGSALGVLPAIAFRAGRADDLVPIADMHRHLFSNRLASGETMPLKASMARGSVSLVGWALSADAPWIRKGSRGFEQSGEPASGAAFGFFRRELGRMKQHLVDQGLDTLTRATDVQAALRGQPHAVLATEGSLFLEGDASRVAEAHRLGVRHIQLVHYTRNPVADFQTERPEHGGLTPFGRAVVAECNRLGILIDVAHCTEQAVDHVIELSKVPVVWSHSSLAAGATPRWDMVGWRARQLTVPAAKRIAARGGVIGLWSFRRDAGQSVAAYAKRMLAMADVLGDDHVAIGSDATGIRSDTDFELLNDCANLRLVVEHWQRLGVPESRVRKVAIQNYARVLTAALD